MTVVEYKNGYFAVGQEIGDASEPGNSGRKGQGDVGTVCFVELREDGAR